MLKEDYCDYDTCVALKELGFSEPTLAYYHGFLPNKPLLYLVIDEDCMPEDGVNVFDLLSNSNKYKDSKNIDAPLLYQAQKWLREEKGMLLQPTYLELSDEWICVIRDKNKRHGYSAQKQKNYEEALSEGIKKVVKILKEK